MRRAFAQRLAFAALLTAGTGAAASAAVDVCTDLQTRLDSLSRNGNGNAAAYNKYDAQVTQQRSALDKATNDARLAGCYGGFFSPKPSASCPQLIATTNALQAKLAQLTATRDQYKSDPYALASQRSDLMRQLQVNRCGAYAMYNPPPQQSGGFFASLFGGGIYNPYGNAQYGGYGSTYRTLCVRSCDGYYFPISFSTTSDRFAADEQTCQAMCPGSNVSLYVHHNPGEDTDAMVSLSGAPYSASPTAFKYRTSYDASCGCGSGGTLQTAQQAAGQPAFAPPGGRPPVTTISIPGAGITFTQISPAATPPRGVIVAKPSLRPSASEDPETLADRSGRLIPAPSRTIDTTVAGLTADGRSIRVVGPSFYIAQ